MSCGRRGGLGPALLNKASWIGFALLKPPETRSSRKAADHILVHHWLSSLSQTSFHFFGLYFKQTWRSGNFNPIWSQSANASESPYWFLGTHRFPQSSPNLYLAKEALRSNPRTMRDARLGSSSSGAESPERFWIVGPHLKGSSLLWAPFPTCRQAPCTGHLIPYLVVLVADPRETAQPFSNYTCLHLA